MEIEMGSPMYFLTLVIALLIFFLVWYFIKDCDYKVKRNVLIIWAFANFALHFFKILVPPYSSILVNGDNNWPYSIANVTVENICAFNTLVLPFAFLFKKQWLKDSIFTISLLGGLGAIIFPEPFNYSYTFELIRYYLCHYSLLVIPLLAITLSINKFSLSSFWRIPLYFFAVEAIIYLNDSLLMELGIYQFRVDFLHPEYFNSASLYRPYVGPNKIGFLDVLIPQFMKKVPEGFEHFNITTGTNYNYGGQDKYWPLLWMICPLIVIGYPSAFFVSALFDYKAFFKLFKRIKKDG